VVVAAAGKTTPSVMTATAGKTAAAGTSGGAGGDDVLGDRKNLSEDDASPSVVVAAATAVTAVAAATAVTAVARPPYLTPLHLPLGACLVVCATGRKFLRVVLVSVERLSFVLVCTDCFAQVARGCTLL